MRPSSGFRSGLGSGFLVLVLASGSVWAQGNARSATVLTAPPTSEGCPVGFGAKRQSGVEVGYAGDGREKSRGQGLQLRFGARDASKKIVKANVTVRGVSGAARVMPVAGDSNDDVAEMFELGLGADGVLRSDIWTRKVSNVRWVDLTEIEYADGSVWTASHGARCRVAPDLFVLVAGGR